MNVQIIEKGGKPEWAVLPFAEYKKVMEALEDARDASDIKTFAHALESGEEETLPQAMVERLALGDDSPVKVWREYRSISQKALAEAAGVSQAYIAQIEKGVREGSIKALKAIAGTLRVDVDDLI
ncbi:MAG: helix-turn-helix transcriptional regulator [Mariprofundaceae bacterium]|nr:helix-turn-helix transcriptional regulator [Mariprofundaceae bacterium]